jgi:hypothetical protein
MGRKLTMGNTIISIIGNETTDGLNDCDLGDLKMSTQQWQRL